MVESPNKSVDSDIGPGERRTSRARRALFGLVVVLGLFGAGEGLCRLIGLGEAPATAAHIADWQTDSEGRRFWVLRGPGHNRDGLRDRDHEMHKPAGVHRIVCLGDSVTAGRGVKRSATYPYLLEQWLSQSGTAVEVFNVATPGWTTRQERIAYTAIARRYQPDTVFLGFCLNDIPEQYNMLQRPPPRMLGWLMRHSALVRALVHAEQRQLHNVRELFDEPEISKVATAWQLVFDDLLILRDQVAADGATLMVLIFPFRFQLEPGAPPATPQQRLAAFCLGHDIAYLDLLPALSIHGPDAFLDESHLTQAGAMVVAHEMIRWAQTGCAHCGFDLQGQVGPTCPNCKKPIAPNARMGEP